MEITGFGLAEERRKGAGEHPVPVGAHKAGRHSQHCAGKVCLHFPPVQLQVAK